MAHAPPGFAAQLIAALEEAQAAAAAPKPPEQLADAGWSKLQFDFPVVSAEELAALAAEYAAGKRTQVSARFLQVLREAAAAPPPAAAAAPGVAAAAGGDAAAPGGPKAELVPHYQRLYAAAVLGALQSCLDAPEAAAAAALAALAPQGRDLAMQGGSVLEEALEAAAAGASGNEAAPKIERDLRVSQLEDDDSVEYEPLEQPRLQQPAAGGGAPAAAAPVPGASAADLPEQLAQLAGHLSYHCMSDVAAWRELRLAQRLAGCLAAARRHPRFVQLQPVAQPMLRLAADRLVAAPVELEAALPALLDALAIPGGSGSSSSSPQGAAADAAAELALSAAVALAGQVSSPSTRRHLWAVTHARLLPVAAAQLEATQAALARAARAAGGACAAALSPQQLYAVMLPCQLLYFYVLEAPRVGGCSSGGAQLQEAFLKAGLLRALVLLFCQLGAHPGAEPLRCALLLACGAAQPLADWAAAVPGFAAAVAAPELAAGGAAALHGAMWRLLLGGSGGELAALLGDAEPADKVPGLYHALQLMADLQAVSRRPAPLWGTDVEAALRTLGDTLRTRYSRARQEAEAAAAGGGSSAANGSSAADGGMEAAAAADAMAGAAAQEAADAAADAAEEAKKLGRPAEEQAAVLAARRAAQLQPACLKLVKDLLHARRGGGAAGKHD